MTKLQQLTKRWSNHELDHASLPNPDGRNQRESNATTVVCFSSTPETTQNLMPDQMETVDCDLLNINFRVNTPITCFVAIFDIKCEQISQTLVIQMHETTVNKVSQNHNDELNSRGLSFDELHAKTQLWDSSCFSPEFKRSSRTLISSASCF